MNIKRLFLMTMSILIILLILDSAEFYHQFKKPKNLKQIATEINFQKLKSLVIVTYKNRPFPSNIKELMKDDMFKYLVNNEKLQESSKYIFTDAWEEEMAYHYLNENEIILVSKGPDKLLNTSDDIEFSIKRP